MKPADVFLTPIGVIHSPYQDPAGMPIQNCGAAGETGMIEIFPAYRDGLCDLDGFERIIILYHFHRTEGWTPLVIPYLDTKKHGLFATRAPRRPNPIGLSIVRLIRVSNGILQVADIDVLDGTPLLDIKPYIPGFDAFPGSRAGWVEEVQTRASETRSDDRFHKDGDSLCSSDK